MPKATSLSYKVTAAIVGETYDTVLTTRTAAPAFTDLTDYVSLGNITGITVNQNLETYIQKGVFVQGAVGTVVPLREIPVSHNLSLSIETDEMSELLMQALWNTTGRTVDTGYPIYASCGMLEAYLRIDIYDGCGLLIGQGVLFGNLKTGSLNSPLGQVATGSWTFQILGHADNELTILEVLT